MDEERAGTEPAATTAEHLVDEEHAAPASVPHALSHRAGTLAGLAVVGLLLGVLVIASPGGPGPRLPSWVKP